MAIIDGALHRSYPGTPHTQALEAQSPSPASGQEPGSAPGPVFLSGQAADSVLRRQKRHNTGFFEEVMRGDLERECLEERCDFEEAREALEDDVKTMEFWVGYVDGDQCKSSPCQNKGACKDQLASYSCTCLPGFTGTNCEIVTARQCHVNNGECFHFCEPSSTSQAKCSCADGYKLQPDGKGCQPEVEFPCGRDTFTVSRRSALANDTEASRKKKARANSSPFPLGRSRATTPAPMPEPSRGPSRSRLPLWVNNSSSKAHVTKDPKATVRTPVRAPVPVASIPSRKKLPLWVYGEPAELPTKEEEEQPGAKTRIVGGHAVTPGEIPWQAALVARPSGQVFCGGAVLGERWVVTAAHCLGEGRQSTFFVRVGEHNLYAKEGSEQDHEVLEQRPHPSYNARLSLYNHDLALLHLATPIVFSKAVRAVCLGPKDFSEAVTKEASPATVSGWGQVRFQGATASVLQKVEVPFTERTECKESSSARITRYMFCAGYAHEAKDSCQGDSGGPHSNRYHDTWFLTGIVSWGEECAKEGKYGVYTRVSHYYRWMHHTMGVARNSLAGSLDEPDP
ncbi:coagulation factor IXa [Aplochiton taeniatus]